MTKSIDTYFSIDVETDGPAPGINNMLTIGVAAFSGEDGGHYESFYRRLALLPDLKSDPKTMTWWINQDEKAREEAFGSGPLLPRMAGPPYRVPAYDVVLELAAWIDRVAISAQSRRRIAMAWPATFDFGFINYYFHRFLGENPLGYAALDLRSYVMGLMRKHGYNEVREEQVNSLFGEVDKSDLTPHIAIDDAIRQGRLFFHIRDHELASSDKIK